MFVGIQLDSATMSTSLPLERVEKLRSMMESVCHSKVISDLHFYNSLLGHLVHAATVCPLGKAFLNHLFALRATLKPGQPRCLNQEVIAELAWWALFLEKWPGISVQQFVILRQPDHFLFCDVSGSWEHGACPPPHSGSNSHGSATPLSPQ